MKNAPIFYLALMFAFFSCHSNKNNDRAFIEFGKVPAPLMDSLKSAGTEMQQKEIDPTKDNIIKGKNGVVIFISAGSFLDVNGKPITSKAIVELKECYSVESFLLSNLQTTHNGDLLQTQGMIYISAKTPDGGAIQIDKTKPVRVEIPVTEQVAGAKIFKGERNDDGSMNWGEMVEPSKLLVPFPIRTLDRGGFELSPNFGITDDPAYLMDKSLIFDDIGKYENTLLATREFKERYNSSYWIKDVTRLYMSNIDKNMWEVDDMAVQLMMKDSSVQRLQYEQMCNDKSKPESYRKFMTSILQDVMTSQHRRIQEFRNFAAQKLTKIDPSKKVADSTIALLAPKRKMPTQDTIEVIRSSVVAFDALEFGWVNVDFFYNDPKAENIKLFALTNEEASIVSLVIPSRQIMISGIPKEDHTYCFTHSEDGYAKLPKGEKAFLVTIGMKDNQLHFAQKEIVLGQNVMEPMDLKAATAEEIKKELKKLG